MMNMVNGTILVGKSNRLNLEKYYQLYYKKAYLFAKSYVRDQYVAEDIASDALVKLWVIMGENEIRHPLTFLLSIVKNKSIDFLRHEVIRQEALANMSDVGMGGGNARISALGSCEPENIYSKEIEYIIRDTLNALPDRTRNVFLMSRYQNLPKGEIAKRLNFTSKGVEYHIIKALKSLRVNLKDYLPVLCLFFL
ncbi:RNA polymerase sigma-70 factor [Bacteroides fluxus]|uniref:RNA polymerase sigma-70 factor n=1 Tax=Bacteroides fluxus TaxID=626930 RepID=UPI002355F1C7|nr:RNA polymerase sigma-70 factor [Bacteroides fluxus]MDY3789611.1 RNA polymerase sigma-70 factor [Bacteroides fluxus]